jgi:hypothetical protein
MTQKSKFKRLCSGALETLKDARFIGTCLGGAVGYESHVMPFSGAYIGMLAGVGLEQLRVSARGHRLLKKLGC